MCCINAWPTITVAGRTNTSLLQSSPVPCWKLPGKKHFQLDMMVVFLLISQNPSGPLTVRVQAENDSLLIRDREVQNVNKCRYLFVRLMYNLATTTGMVKLSLYSIVINKTRFMILCTNTTQIIVFFWCKDAAQTDSWILSIRLIKLR